MLTANSRRRSEAARRFTPALLIVLMLITLLGQSLPVTPAAAMVARPQAPDLQRIADKARANGSVRLIVQLNTAYTPEGNIGDASAIASQRQSIGQAQQSLQGRLAGRNARVLNDFKFIPFTLLEADADTVAALAADPEVISVQEDRLSAPLLAESIPLIGGSATGTFGAAGRTGAGQTVAILDTGVMKTHTFLTGKVVAEACYSTTSAADGATAVCTPGSVASGSGVNCSTAISGCDHGTHVAGIVAGKGPNFNGVAKDATLIAVQVFTQFTGATNCGAWPNPDPCVLSYTSDQIKGLERVYALRNTFSIASVNMSLGGGAANNTNCDAQNVAQKAAIDNLLSVGIATVIASGNSSFTNGVGSPACISSAVTVGSTTKSDTVSSFSNSGEPIDLLAPGSDITSSVTSSTTAFGVKSGTSMATPMVAGAWAVLKQHKPTATVAEIQTVLQNTGVSITDTRNNLTRKRISLTAAVNTLVPTPNPKPTLTSLSPVQAIGGAPAYTLIVDGSNFVSGALVRWNGSNRVTTFVSPTQLSATITVADLRTAGIFPVTVFNPAPGGGLSAALSYRVVSSCNRYEPNNTLATAQTASVDQIQIHAFCTANDQDWLKFAATPAYRYRIDTSNLATDVNTVVSIYDANGTVIVPETQDAATPATSLVSFVPTTAGTYYVQVRNRTAVFSENHTYNLRLTRTVVPYISSLSPASREAGWPAFTLRVLGTNFAPTAVVRWNGANRTTTFVSATELRAAITQVDIRTAGTRQVSVLNATGGEVSNAATFTVTPMATAPVPTITQLSPATRPAGGGDFVLRVIGTNFVPRSYIRWASTSLPTTYVSATELRATIPAANVATAGTQPVRVLTGAPGGGTSNPSIFTVTAVVTPCDLDEPNNDIATAKQYTPFGSVRTYAFCASGDNDYMWLSATANGKYLIEVTGVAPSVDIVVEAYAPDGTYIGKVDDFGMGQGEGVILTTDSAGRYYIKFRDYWNAFGTTTTYSIKATVQTGLVGGEAAPSEGTPVQNGLETAWPGGGK